jgi:hypothetical protein
VIRETGWTVREYLEQPMGDVFDLVRHLDREPPANPPHIRAEIQSERSSNAPT